MELLIIDSTFDTPKINIKEIKLDMKKTKKYSRSILSIEKRRKSSLRQWKLL